MNSSAFTVFLIEDDPGVMKGLSRMLEAHGYDVRKFAGARPFLEQHPSFQRGCAIVDYSLPDLDGLALQTKMAEEGVACPVIFVSGVGSVTISVSAMKAGAIDFLTKPVKSQDLLAAVSRASVMESERHERQSEISDINDRVALLTTREKEVLTCVIAGFLNKQIAAQLNISEKTVKLHRGRMMRKMGVRSVADLVRVTERVGIVPPRGAAVSHCIPS
jgi:FixJ family two-component response regulator